MMPGMPGMPQGWAPEEPDQDPWPMARAGQAPNFRPAPEGEMTCSDCKNFDVMGRKCKKFGQEAAPFMTCDAIEPAQQQQGAPAMPGPPAGMPPGMPPVGM